MAAREPMWRHIVITPDMALKMVTTAIERAKEMGLAKGHVVIYNMQRIPLASASLGQVPMSNVLVANAKARTVLNTGRDSHAQGVYMKSEGIDPRDYAGAVETSFGGGMLISVNTGILKKDNWPMGVIAFSGGTVHQDITVVHDAVGKFPGFSTNAIPDKLRKKRALAKKK